MLNTVNDPALEKKAIKAALDQQWEKAIKLNLLILEKNPDHLKTKLRLGRAYLQTKEFSKATKIFKEVLDADPINKIAKKNYELAKSKKTDSKTSNGKSSLVKEPGTTTEVNVELTKKGFTANKISQGDKFDLNILKTKVNIVLEGDSVAEIKDKYVVQRLNKADEMNAKTLAVFIKGENKEAKFLIRSSEPVFKGQKQDVKPYVLKGSIKEPELEIENFDDDIEE